MPLPLVATAVAHEGAGAVKRAGQGLSPTQLRNAGLLVLGLAVVGVGIWQGKKLIEGIESKLKAFNHDRPGNKGYATEMASVFVAAFNPNWFGWGTDEKAVFELAQQMYDRGIGIADIDKAYSGDFVKDLESELDPDELQRFHRIRRGEEIYTTAQA